MGARGRARDLQPPSLIDGGNLWQTEFTVCRWAPRGRARGTYSPLGFSCYPIDGGNLWQTKFYSMQPMGARGRARDLQPPSLIDGGNLWQTEFTVCRWAPRGRARGTYSPLGCWKHVAPHVVGNFSFCWRNFGKMMYANCIF